MVSGELCKRANYTVIILMLAMVGACLYVAPRFVTIVSEGRTGDFLGMYSADVFFALCTMYVLISFSSSLFTAKRILKRLELRDNTIKLRTAYFKSYEFKLTDIVSFNPITWSWYMTDVTLLRKLDENYVITFNDGAKFYLSAESGTIDGLVERLSALASESNSKHSNH